MTNQMTDEAALSILAKFGIHPTDGHVRRQLILAINEAFTIGSNLNVMKVEFRKEKPNG
jgi:hypothetical protein